MKFTNSHEWVKVEKDLATIGITALAQKELGEIVHVELPRLGCKVRLGEEVVVLESSKAAVDIYSPLTGEIIKVNTHLLESPHLLNTSPESSGWLFKLRYSLPEELEKLIDEKEYRGQ